MSDDFRARVRRAMEKHHEKLIPRERAKRGNPEDAVTFELLKHLRALGFSMDVVDSSTFDRVAGYHTSNSTAPGFSDLVGCSPDGWAIYIEMKAPGKRNTLRPSQREFLTEKIKCGAFAIVCDSVSCFETAWNAVRDMDSCKLWLLSQLPKLSAVEKRRADEDLSFDE